MFFTKGAFTYNFQTGTKGEPYRRSKMGCRLVDSKPNTKTFSLGVFDEIVEFPVPNRKGKHPYMKPPQFSTLFHQILCGQKYEPKTGTPHPPIPQPKVLDPCCGAGTLVHAFAADGMVRAISVIVALTVLLVVAGMNAPVTMSPEFHSARELTVAWGCVIIALLAAMMVLCWAIRGTR